MLEIQDVFTATNEIERSNAAIEESNKKMFATLDKVNKKVHLNN